MMNEDEETVPTGEESIATAAESKKSDAEDVPVCKSDDGVVESLRLSEKDDAEVDHNRSEEEEAIVQEPSSLHVDIPAQPGEAVVVEVIVEEEEEIIFVEEEEEEANETTREDGGTASVASHDDDVPEDDPSDEPPPPPPPRSISSSFVPPPPPPVVVGMDSARRTAWHNKLRAYEANRRSSHATKITSSSLYWRSFRALIHSSVEETKRAERMIRANITADATYAQYMKAAFLNILNDDGTPILDEKRKQRALKERENESSGGGGVASPSSNAAISPTSKSFGTSATSSDPRSSLLKSLMDSHSVMADRFDESASLMEKEILPQLVKLREKLEEEVKVHETLGNAFLEYLEGADNAVIETWDLYYTIAVKALSGNSSNSSRRKGATSCSESGSSSVEDISTVANINDVWLAEMRYRVAVAYVSALWDKAHSELSRLFTRLKETECQRRLRLADLLRSFVQKKERLFLGLTSILTPAIQDLANKHIDNAAIEDDVQTAIRIRAQNMKKAEIEAKKAGTTKIRDHPGLVGVDIVSGKFELTSPLTSELLCKAKVVERKVGGVMGGGWKPSLAVVTMDDFLHLFDIASSTSNHKIGCGSAPEVAFHTLMPPITIPTQDNIGKISASGEKSSSQKGWSDISPSMSIILPNSTISFSDSGNSSKPNNCFLEITETYINHGASLVFGKTSTRKVQIRTSTRDEILDWISFIKAEK